MNNKELADRVVALGVGQDSGPDHGGWIYRFKGQAFRDSEFVSDWRVAGAMMEKVIEWGGFSYVGSRTTDTFQASAYRGYGQQKRTNHGVNESLPRAIIEACVEALS